MTALCGPDPQIGPPMTGTFPNIQEASGDASLRAHKPSEYASVGIDPQINPPIIAVFSIIAEATHRI